jgi:hypothetical protein
MSDALTLEEEFAQIDRNGGWDNYKLNYFAKLDKQQRATELGMFERMLQDEARPSRSWAGYLAKKRELDDLHKLFSDAGR